MGLTPAAAKSCCFISGHRIPESYRVRYIRRYKYKYGIQVEESFVFAGKCLDCGELGVDYTRAGKEIRTYVLWFKEESK